MKQMLKCTATIFASILVALCLTSCTPEKVVEVVREVETEAHFLPDDTAETDAAWIAQRVEELVKNGDTNAY